MKHKKKKVFVLYSKGGGGHISAMKAIKFYLRNNYEVKEICLIEEIIQNLDFIRKITFSFFNAEDLYNFFISHKMIKPINWLTNLARRLIPKRGLHYDRLMKFYFIQKKPDLVISVIPIYNECLINSLNFLKIPFLVIPADLDTNFYWLNINQKYTNYQFTLPFQNDLIINNALKHLLNYEFIFTGFPLKKDFFEKKNKKKILADFDLPNDKPIIMLMMGANGSSKILEYLKEIKNLQHSLHLVVCIGSQKKLRKRINRFSFSDLITFSIVEFTSRISDLMYISDILITKPGATTICEAIQMQLPLIIDNISAVIEWEKMNITFINEYYLGVTISSYDEINKKINLLLNDKEMKENIKKNMKKFNSLEFDKNINKIVSNLVDK